LNDYLVIETYNLHYSYRPFARLNC